MALDDHKQAIEDLCETDWTAQEGVLLLGQPQTPVPNCFFTLCPPVEEQAYKNLFLFLGGLQNSSNFC